jgi:hypothetical protein
MEVNSPEYKALVSGFLGKEVKFHDVPKIPKKTVAKKVAKSAKKKTEEKIPVPKKKTKKSVLKSEEQKIYLLFNTSAFGNSDDYAYELDYAFRGAYRSEEQALAAAANTIIQEEDEDDELENKLFDRETNFVIVDNARDISTEQGWKILVTNVE